MGKSGVDNGLWSGGLANIDAACRFLSISRTALYSLMDRNELQFIKIGKSRRIPWSALENLIAAKAAAVS
jgi:excisionase family DNA binding protein